MSSPQLRSQAAQYADQRLQQVPALAGLGDRIRRGTPTLRDVQTLRNLQQQHPQEAERIGLVLMVIGGLQASVQQQVAQVQSHPKTLRELPEGNEYSAGMIQYARMFFQQRGGYYDRNVTAFAHDLAQRSDSGDYIKALFLNLSAPGRDLRDPLFHAIGQALVMLVRQSQQSPLWLTQIGNARERFHALENNLRLVQVPAGQSEIQQRPGTLPLPGYAQSGPQSTPAYNPITSMSVSSAVVAPAVPQAPSTIQYSWSGLNGHQILTMLMGQSMPAHQRIGNDVFVQKCTHVFTEIIRHAPERLEEVANALLAQRPVKSVQQMMQALLEGIETHYQQIEAQKHTDTGLRTFKAVDTAARALTKRLRVSDQVLHYMKYIPQNPGQALALMKKFEHSEISPEDADQILALNAAYHLCPKEGISDRLMQHMQKSINIIDARRQLFPVLLKMTPEGLNGWKLLHHLASGGMGTVFVSQMVSFGKMNKKIAAVKVCQSDDEMNKRGFLREARILSDVEGEHIVGVYDSGLTEEGNAYIVMEYIDGPEANSGAFDGDDFVHLLRQSKAEQTPVPPDALAIIAWKLALGIKEFQSQHIVQRDLKPANFLLTPKAAKAFKHWQKTRNDIQLIDQLHKLIQDGDHLIKWTDFGLAKKTTELTRSALTPEQEIALLHQKIQSQEIDLNTSFSLTNDGAIVGTPGYMPPESACGTPEDAYTDQYALGIILFEFFSQGCWPSEPKPTGVMMMLQDALMKGQDQQVSYALPDDPRLSMLDGYAYEGEMRRLIGQLTTINSPAARGRIPDIVMDLEKIAFSSSPEARKKRKAEQELIQATERQDEALFEANQARQGKDTMRKLLATIGTVSAALVVSLFLYIANLRPDDHVGYGKQRIAWVDQADALEQKSVEQLRDLLRSLETLEEQLPEGYTVNTEAGEPDRAQLMVLKTQITQRIAELQQLAARRERASRLIGDGDALLTQASPDFEGAREKYEAAKQLCPDLATTTEAKLDATNQAEVKWSYEQGMKAYWKSDIENATRHLQRIQALGHAGLSEKKDEVETALSLLNGWKQKSQQLGREAYRLAMAEPSRITSELPRLLDQAKNGSRDASTIILLACSFFSDNRQPQIFKDAEEQEGLSPTAAAHKYSQHPEVLQFVQIRGYFFSASFELGKIPQNVIQNPGTALGIQSVYRRDLHICTDKRGVLVVQLSVLERSLAAASDSTTQSRLRTELSHMRKNYREWVIALLHSLSDFSDHVGQYDLLITLPSQHASFSAFFQTSLNETLQEALLHLPPEERALLLSEIERTFPGSKILDQARPILTQ